MDRTDDTAISARQTFRWWLLITIGAILNIVSSPQKLTLHDDTSVVFTYARHFLESGAFYWNKEEGAIDGFTSMLDVLLKSILTLVVPEKMYEASAFLSCIISALIPGTVLFLLIPYAKTPSHRRLLICLCFLLSFESLTGFLGFMALETPQYVLLGLILVGLFYTDTSTTGVLAVSILWILCRHEAIFLMLLIHALHFLIYRKRHSTLFSFLIALILYLGWRMYYFGYWAPNTFYAKRSSMFLNELQDGLHYVALHLQNPAIAASLLLTVFSLLIAWQQRNQAGRSTLWAMSFTCCATALGSIVLVIFSGGDCYILLPRFLCLPVFLSYLSFSSALLQLDISRKSERTILAGLSVLILSHIVMPSSFKARIKGFENPTRGLDALRTITTCDAEAARKLNSYFPGARVAEVSFEALKFWADDLSVLGLCGLHDRDIAHAPDSAPNQWGKCRINRGGVPITGIPENVDIWFQFHRFRKPMSVAGQSREIIFGNPLLFRQYLGFKPRPSEQFLQHMTLGSIEACGRYYNFLIRRDLLKEQEQIFIG